MYPVPDKNRPDPQHWLIHVWRSRRPVAVWRASNMYAVALVEWCVDYLLNVCSVAEPTFFYSWVQSCNILNRTKVTGNTYCSFFHPSLHNLHCRVQVNGKNLVYCMKL
jgi:hypothetical protein